MTDELIAQLKRIADALEAGNKILEKNNTINEGYVALQKQWRLENLDIAEEIQTRQEDHERQTREQALKLQQEFNDAMLAKYETQLREQLRENALASPIAPTARLVKTMADLGEE